MLSTRMAVMVGAVLLAAATGAVSIFAQSTVAGPVGPSPYDVVRGWHNPLPPGFLGFAGR